MNKQTNGRTALKVLGLLRRQIKLNQISLLVLILAWIIRIFLKSTVLYYTTLELILFCGLMLGKMVSVPKIIYENVF